MYGKYQDKAEHEAKLKSLYLEAILNSAQVLADRGFYGSDKDFDSLVRTLRRRFPFYKMTDKLKLNGSVL